MKINLLIFIVVVCFQIFTFPVETRAEVGIGSRLEEIFKAYGTPTGEMISGKEHILCYPAGIIKIVDDKVVHIDEGFRPLSPKLNPDAEFNAEQAKKGLMLHKGMWMKPEGKNSYEKQQKTVFQLKIEEFLKKVWSKAPKQTDPGSLKAVKIYKEGGSSIDLNQVIVPGKVTIVDFYADWCGPCRRISPYLEKLATSEKEVFLRKIDIVNWNTPVVRQYNIRSVPNIRVFNRRGEMVGKPTSSYQEVLNHVNNAK